MTKRQALLISFAAMSLALNAALILRLQSIVAADSSYILEPDSGAVWRIDTHAEFLGPLLSDSWLPQWANAPIRTETSDSLFLAGYLTPITSGCDWRRFERYRKLQRTCFHHTVSTSADTMTLMFEAVPKVSRELAAHPVVALVSERIATDGRLDESPRLLTPILMTYAGSVSHSQQSPPAPKSAILFRGWAARNFEIATGIEPPRASDAWSER